MERISSVSLVYLTTLKLNLNSIIITIIIEGVTLSLWVQSNFHAGQHAWNNETILPMNPLQWLIRSGEIVQEKKNPGSICLVPKRMQFCLFPVDLNFSQGTKFLSVPSKLVVHSFCLVLPLVAGMNA